jgi:hypothetical protein
MTSKSYKPSIGSISHGTLRTPDLIEAFADELDRIETDRKDVAEARAVLTLINAGWTIENDMSDAMSDLIIALQDALSEHAPAFCYFGANEGDGSDFGFWPSMDAIDELPRISDPSEADEHDECAFVNDHGNVSIYVNGAIVLDIA